MKALTVQQPWAWAIVHGSKDVENRTQAWSYRGPLAIHAGGRWSDRGGHSRLVAEALLDQRERAGWRLATPSREQVLDDYERVGIDPRTITARGAIIGVVDLVDAHRALGYWTRDNEWRPGCCDSPWAECTYRDHAVTVHLELANPRPLAQPIPCRGRLGLWTPPADVLEQLAEVPQ